MSEEVEPKLIATYTYTDIEGNPVYEVQRYEPKTFKQRHLKDGEWKWGLPADIPKQLYHNTRFAEGDTVVVVEGERDVHSLEGIGLIATTSSGGAGFKWFNPETGETQPFVYDLASKRVIVCPDNDEAGKAHAEDVIRAITGVASSRAILNIPPGFKDVTEFLGDFSDSRIEKFEQLIESALLPENAPVRKIKEILESKGVPDARKSEKLILGAVMNNDSSFREVAELTVDDFAGRDHQLIWKAIASSDEEKESVDAATVSQILDDRGQLEDIGGMTYLIELIEELPNSFSIDTHVGTLKERSSARKLLSGMIKGSEDILLGRNVETIRQSLSELANSSDLIGKDNPTSSVGEIVNDIDEFLKPIPMGLTVPLLPTLFKMMFGLHTGQLVVVAGRPSNGKSALAAEISSYAAIAGNETEVISLEVGKEDDIKKRACQLARVCYNDVISGNLTEDQKTRIIKNINGLTKKPLRVDDSSNWNLTKIRNHLKKRMLQGKPVRLLVIDYLQLMKGTGRFESKNIEIGDITRGLKLLAKEFNLTIVLLSQLSKSNEKEGRKPQLSDLRDSGSIEQDADIVIFIHRDPSVRAKYIDVHIEPVLIILAKQRNGATGEHEVSFAKPYALFFENSAVDIAKMNSYLGELG